MTKENQVAELLQPIASDKFFETLVNTAVSPFVVIDMEFTLRYASDTIKDLLGWEPEEWIGQSVTQLMTPESAEIIAIGIMDLLATQTDSSWVGAPVRIFLRCADDTYLALDAQALSPLRTGIDGIVVQLNRAGGAQTLGDAVDAILEGNDLERALTLLSSLIEHDISYSIAALAQGWNGSVFERISGNIPVTPLDPPRPRDCDAIRHALTSSQVAVDLFPLLDPESRREAEAAGKRACWLAPIRISTNDAPTSALIIWHADEGPPGAFYTNDIKRSVNLARVALRWLDQQRLLAWDAAHDRLTGLANRSEFQTCLEACDGDARGVLYCDLDDFKPVNDRFGHRTGDRVLAAVAGRLRTVAGESLVARLGGDEFAILVHPLDKPDVAISLAESVLHALRQPISVLGQQAKVGISIGVCIDELGVVTADHLLDEADRVLRDGKAHGKNQVRVAALTTKDAGT